MSNFVVICRKICYYYYTQVRYIIKFSKGKCVYMVDNIENKLQGDYYTKEFINIKKYLTDEYNDILKKLNINIEDKELYLF